MNNKIVLYNKTEVEMFSRIIRWACSVYYRHQKHIINERGKEKNIDVYA